MIALSAAEVCAASTTTVSPATEDLAAFIGGFVAAEGCFTGTSTRYTFSVGLGAADEDTCWLLQDYFACGSVFRSPRRRPHYDDEVSFAIQSMSDHVHVTIPFMDQHLPWSYKRQQYLAWRRALLDYQRQVSNR